MMKRNYLIIVLLALFLLPLFTSNAYADVFKWVRVGNLWARVFDNGHQSETAGTHMATYYVGGSTPGHTEQNFLRCAGLRFGCKDWTDENGKIWPVKLAGAPYGTSDETSNTFAVPDANGITIHRYFRYTPPTIVVDGGTLNDPFPLEGDEVAPDKIPGTADLMIESHIRNWMGLEIDQKVLGWSQHNHDDYVVWDLTITNTGNIDHDDDIELPNQTIKDLYIMRQYEIFPNSSEKEWGSWYGCRPGDSLRITYSYPYRSSQDYDNFGYTQSSTGWIRGPVWGGEAMVHIDTSPTDPTDNLAQPQMHCIGGPDDLAFKHESGTKGPSDWALVYDVMQFGYSPVRDTPYMEGTYPNTHHDLEPDMRPVKFLTDFTWWFWHAVTSCAIGPYTLEPGQSIRIVYALTAGSISDELAWKVGEDWKAGNATWPNGDPAADMAGYYPAFGRNPDLAADANDQAKDRWICSGKDSLFTNAMAAQWAVNHDYNVPVPPPPPSVEVKSLPDRIRIIWSNDSESASDFSGYRIYRAVGGSDYFETGGVVTGKFERIFECGGSSGNPVVNSYDDVTAERGKAYYYYVTAYDDGTQNGTDFNGKIESLESGHYSNRTTQGAHLTRAPGQALSEIRVVPNPFNIRAAELQWPGEGDKILFMNLPPKCTINIYTESGDLVKTLAHTDGSGDEPWGVLSQEWSATETGQIIVSGIYIAHIEVPGGESKNVKFLVVR